MSHVPSGWGRRLAVRLLCVVLRLYPPSFRRRWGASMEAALRDRVAAAPPGWRGSAGILFRLLPDLLGSALGEWLDPTAPGDPAGSPREESWSPMLDALMQDLRFALRSLARRPAFTSVAVVTLALGIGANTAIFSVVNGVLLRPLPYPEPDRIHMIWKHDADDPEGRGTMSRPDLDDVRELPSIAAIAGYSRTNATLSGGDGPVVVPAVSVTRGLLEVFAVTPALGRDLTPEETAGPDGPLRVVIGWDLWQERFGGRRDVVGTTIEISERAYEVVGVAPAGFDFPEGARLWYPDHNSGTEGCSRACHVVRAVARLAPGLTADAAGAELAVLAERLSDTYPDSNFGKRFRAESLTAWVVGDVRTGLWIVLGAVAFVLLIACANVANLILARSTGRKTEMAVRAALGAGRRRLGAQVLVESLVLAGAGAGAGVALAWAAVSGLRGLAAGSIPRIEEVAIDPATLGYTALVAVCVAVLFGMSPALHAASSSVADGLGAGGRGGSSGREGRSRGMLLSIEVGLSLVLLVGAGLLLRSFQRLHAVDLGFDADDVARFQVSLPPTRYADLESVMAFLEPMEAGLRAIPGVVAVGSGFGTPMGHGRVTADLIVEGRPPAAPGEELGASMQPITPGYLDALRIPLLRGRPILPTDEEGTPMVALVNEAFVREVFPGEDPIGRRVHVSVGFGFDGFEGENEPMWEIVGVVGDVRSEGPRVDPEPEVYAAVAQFGPAVLEVHARVAGSAGGAAGVIALAREVLDGIDPNVPLRYPGTLEEAVAGETAVTRFYLTLLVLFAALAVVLAAVGLYGVVSYLVSRRRREVGIRMALGARGGEITRLLVVEGLRPAVLGLVGGLGVAMLGGRVVESVLFGVEPTDPAVLGGVTLLLLFVVVAASLVPAGRATRMAPTVALRSE